MHISYNHPVFKQFGPLWFIFATMLFWIIMILLFPAI